MKHKSYEMAALLRLDLSSFICRTFQELSPQTDYLHNWHVDLIASKLMQVARGEITRLIINVPPRNLKSICASVAFPAWVLGRKPSTKIICASYASDLAMKLATDCRQVMLSPWYQEAFLKTRLSARMAVHDFTTTARGGRMAVSTGGGITGRGGDILIIDDPIKPDEALSEVTRKNVKEWFDGTAYTRLDSKRHGAIVIIMQRLHLEDLAGYVQEKGGWEVINLPAIAEEDTEIEFETIFGRQKIVRLAGTALHPEREPLETLESIRAAMGEFRFSGQYQQSPVPEGGAMIKTDWIKVYELSELPPSFEMVVQSWDTASKDHNFADFSVCVTMGLKNKMIYVLDVRRARMDFPTLRRTAIELARQYKPHTILVEDASSGIQLVQELKQERIYSVKPFKPQGDKQTRLFAQQSLFESGVVRVPKEAHWVTGFVHELTSFPFHKFNDQVDAISQGLAYLRERLDEPGFIAYYRQLYEEKHGHELRNPV
ncbi:MAG: phage terminase large subunit [Syntrophales bacterium]|jgi:predicted phage terminase large subunit-like protein